MNALLAVGYWLLADPQDAWIRALGRRSRNCDVGHVCKARRSVMPSQRPAASGQGLRTIALLCAVFCQMISSAQEVHIPLNECWSFRQVGTEQWYPAQVPGVVQQDLLRNGLIPDPMHNANADSVQWIELKDWEYRRTLVADEAMLKHGHLDLVFKGLDTFAEVYLNDSLLGKADNMFRSWEWPVKALLKPGANELKVIFRSPIVEGAKLREAYGLQLPHDSDPSGVSPYIRKPAYQFGWDFAPRLVTCGIWQEVELHCWSAAWIGPLYLNRDTLSAGDDVRVDGFFYSDGTEARKINVKYRAYVDDTLRLKGKTRTCTSCWGPSSTRNRRLRGFRAQPWFPVGHGAHKTNSLRVEIWRNGVLLDTEQKRVGFRTIDLDRSTDVVGERFAFRINGQQVFAKGCNLVAPNVFPNEIKTVDWLNTVRDLQRANMNMVRIWAGGLFPPEEFYSACDTAGIMVWQDLMFASLVPTGIDYRFTNTSLGREYLDNSLSELDDLSRRCDHHPSMVLWCGNNELDVAWKNWGWQQRYDLHGSDSVRVSQVQEKFFEESIPEAFSGQPYLFTSPLSNWGNAEGLKNGDLHYWGVWHGDSAFSSFKNNVGRFVSEYGFQSYPDSATLATQLDPDHLFLGSPMLAKRQKSYKTDKPIWTAIDREFAVKPRYLGEFILFSQLAQAEAYRQAIWAHVTGQPYCMGTLFWQLNDVWAGPSWSTVDHTGTWKAAMYEVARSYKPVVLDLEMANGTVTATLWNERTDLKAGKLVTQVFRTDGQRISSDTSVVALTTGKAEVLSAGQEALLKEGGADRHVVRVAVLDVRGEVLVERILPFKRMGEMAWDKAEVRLERVGGAEGSATYRVSTDKPVPSVKLALKGAEFSDNYFPLVPGQDRLVTVSWRSGSLGQPELSVWP